jgi:hypothetical protein
MVLRKWISTCRQIKLDLYFKSYKINLKYTKNLYLSTETIKVLKENITEMLYGIGLHDDFLDTTPKTQAT